MKQLATIGSAAHGVPYIDRPTVKVILRTGNKILLLNDGLLPGGGVDEGETLREGIQRELQEELGAVVTNIKEIGIIEQFRTFLEKRYLVYGFSADVIEFNDTTNPQDEGEAAFSVRWVSIDEAPQIIQSSIRSLENTLETPTDDAAQGKLYNLKTTLVLVQSIQQ